MAMRALLSCVFGFVLCLAYVEDVQACHVEYVLKEKDTLENIAHQIYNDHTKWRVIYYANQDRIDGTSLLKPGTAIRLPCAAGNVPPQLPAAPPVAQPKPAAASLDQKERPGVMIPFNMTSTDGVGAKVGFILARNARISHCFAHGRGSGPVSPPPRSAAGAACLSCACQPQLRTGRRSRKGSARAGGQFPHLFLKGTGTDAKVTYHSHLGNLPNLIVEKDGTASQEIAVPRLTLDDIRGRSIVIHATRDGDSARQACGVVP